MSKIVKGYGEIMRKKGSIITPKVPGESLTVGSMVGEKQASRINPQNLGYPKKGKKI